MTSLEKINQLMLEELAQAVNQELELKNVLVTITYVDCSPDLKNAKVGFSVLPDKLSGTVLKKLNIVTGQIISLLRPRLRLRRIPHIIWQFDDSEREADRIQKIISEI